MLDTTFTCLRSPRLLLRRLEAADLPFLCDYRSRPEVARYQDWETFTRADGERFLEAQARSCPGAPGAWFQLALVLSASGTLVGDCGLHCRADNPQQTEVGITLAPEHQGKGYAAEALACVLDYLFFTLKMHRVTAVTDAANAPAASLLERVGMRREGHFLQNVWFKGAWGDEFLYAVLRGEWERKRQARPAGRDLPDGSSKR
jgi:RimJ/RimL family protein N-acetyltransferase